MENFKATLESYFASDNAKLLENILSDEQIKSGLSIDQLRLAANNKYSKKDEELSLAVNWCAESVRKYISIKGALCKGELEIIGSKFLSDKKHVVDGWKFNLYLMENHKQQKGKSLVLKDVLKKGNKKGEHKIHNMKLYEFLQDIKKQFVLPHIIAYKKITEIQHIVWFENYDSALKYVKDFLTVKGEEEVKPEKKEKKEEKPDYEKEKKQLIKKNTSVYSPITGIKPILNITPETTPVVKEKYVQKPEEIEAKQAIDTPVLFAEKYGLINQSFAGRSFVQKDDIDKILLDAGLRDKDVRLYLRNSVVRNRYFSNIFRINDSDTYDLHLLNSLAVAYLSEKEFMKDFKNVFETQK